VFLPYLFYFFYIRSLWYPEDVAVFCRDQSVLLRPDIKCHCWVLAAVVLLCYLW